MTAKSQQSKEYIPTPITKIEDTGLPDLWLQDLVLKIIYFGGYLTGFQVAERVALPFAGIVEYLVGKLKKDKFVEVRSSVGGVGEGAYQYGITAAGTLRAREALERTSSELNHEI